MYKNEYKFEKKFLFINCDFLFNKMKENNIKEWNRSIYRYYCRKKSINIFFEKMIVLKDYL